MTDTVARVYVNGVEVGSLPATDYDQIVRRVNCDRQLYIRQAWNFSSVFACFFWEALRFTPFFLFLTLCWLVLFDDGSISYLRDILAKMNPAEMTTALRRLVIGSIAASALLKLCAHTFHLSDYNYGYVNKFRAAINQRIRELLEVPAEGHMKIDVVEQRKPGIPNDFVIGDNNSHG